VIAAGFAMLSAPLLTGTASIFTYLQYMNSVYSIPIFAVVVIALWTCKVPAFAANTALIAGCILSGLQYVISLKINAFHYAGIVFTVLILFLLIAGRLRPEDRQMPEINPVDMTPWKYTQKAGAFLIVLVFLSYILPALC